MIDWISGTFPFKHKNTVHDGAQVVLDAAGDVKFQRLVPRQFVGSYEVGIRISTDLLSEDDQGNYTKLRFDGNPTKLFQGHNLWGTDDVHGLLMETHSLLRSSIEGYIANQLDLSLVSEGAIPLRRVDINESFELPSLSDCLTWIRAAEHSTRLKHRGRGEMTGSTLYFGKKSTRWATKIYAKGQEIKDHPREKQPALVGLIQPQAWANRSLRVEHVIRGPELKRRGLDLAGNWGDNTASELHQELLQKLEFSEAMNVSPAILDELPGSLRGAYALWKEGHDLRAVYSRPTFYRYRSKLLAYGVDIAIKQTSTQTNVVPLVRILEAVPQGVPDWAYGTSLYFEPRRRA